jgi:succinate dehydrogenase / fumarate reductase, membrane anchor subunit
MSDSVSNNFNKTSKKTNSAYDHWIRQRIFAVFLIFFSIWMFYFIPKISKSSVDNIVIIMKEPINVVLTSIFVLFGLYHGTLGMQVIIEDYVSNILVRNSLILATKIISLLTALIFLAGLIYNLLI